MGNMFSNRITLLLTILLVLALLLGCEKEDEKVLASNVTASPIILNEEKPIPEITFYSLECLNNYYEYVTPRTYLTNISSSDDQYYYYLNYFNKKTQTLEHGIFPKCSFVKSLNQFSNILNSLKYPCCSHAPLLEIKEEPVTEELVRRGIEYLFKANNVQEYAIKSITETNEEYFITISFTHTIKEGNFGGVKTGLAYFKVDKITRKLYEVKQDAHVVNRWDETVKN
ncbi:hypothetical protein HYY69_04295 [Candidatus Woesearchaeota archaeon]|nr:hypothetical protein [Candidatus Woesearchaeota archaeon]